MRQTGSCWKQHHEKILVAIVFLLFLASSIDFWNWQSVHVSFLHFPLWLWYNLILTLLLIPCYFLVVQLLWREP
ncbi:MAG: hypothetical protein QCI00_00755 [Candidatus Thermoplasmatota archaeon]|nr:hypothetical protein [Candidatus Thermoplasmatota archaeon]